MVEAKKIQQFTDLDAWRVSHDIVLEVYRITKAFPKDELFGLTSQMRRCAVSITSNIAEGFGRRSYKEKIQFYAIAQGSVTELQNQLMIARDIHYIQNSEFEAIDQKLTRAHKLLTGLIKASHFLPKMIGVAVFLFFLLPFSIFLFPSDASAAGLTRPANNLGLIGYWSFEDATGTQATDSSGKGNTGTLTNMEGADWVSGKRGKALNFDGSNEFVALGSPSSLNLSRDFTVSAWIKRDSTGRIDSIASNGAGGWYFRVSNSNKLNFLKANTADIFSGNTTIAVDTWYHVALTVNASATAEMKLWVNGSQDATTTSATTFSGSNTSIGAEEGGNSEFFDGIIDDVRIYNRALSAAEIATLASAGAIRANAPNNLGLVGYWSMEDATGTQATDFSGKGNTGTLTGSPSWVSGARGKALQFSGTTKYVCPGNITTMNSSTAMTVSAWFNISALNDNDFIAQKGSVFFLGRSNGIGGNTLQFSLNGSAAWHTATTAVPSFNVWHHAVGVYNGTNVLLFLDGVKSTGDSYSGSSNGTTQHFCFGGENDNNNSIDGIVDEVRVYNRALSDQEVSDLYNTAR